MTNEQLQQLVEEISMRDFQKPFLHQAYFNHRLKTTAGRYLLHSHNIEINPKQYEEYEREILIGIIKHELCHYHLHLENKGYKHRDRDFKELLKKVNGLRYCEPPKETRRKETIKYRYQCKQCEQIYLRKRKIDVKKYVCGTCRGELLETIL